MIQISLPAAYRSNFGKGAARQLRMKELTPAVMYSGGNDSVALQFDSGLLYKNLFDIHGQNAVVTLTIEGDDKNNRHVMVKEIQKNPVTDELVHVDFLEIAIDKPAIFAVALKFVGTAKGVDLGGELHVHRKTVRVKGAPLDIPDFIEINIKDMARGDSVSVADLPLPGKVEMVEDSKAVCVAIS